MMDVETLSCERSWLVDVFLSSGTMSSAAKYIFMIFLLPSSAFSVSPLQAFDLLISSHPKDSARHHATQ
ncbi:hypothetical protein PsorP6_014686 [Peronosclerospora sorghi]|uniref:Uncharacterized protein n=1 Tax=Peronosclerospora sorghi TaxID=230839 RepID=A0ACC0VVL4_9STRA|nr:hypothetical protein PsorP6_014686 [Peronosclerospora sorghi]